MGHWVMLQAPERFHALVREWLPDLTPAPSPAPP